jgi:protocatechuate 3,4-dioxygenase beta subunit
VINFFTCKPISSAVLDFCQADSNGKYDTVDFNLRGKVISDKNGNYILKTITHEINLEEIFIDLLIFM